MPIKESGTDSYVWGCNKVATLWHAKHAVAARFDDYLVDTLFDSFARDDVFYTTITTGATSNP